MCWKTDSKLNECLLSLHSCIHRSQLHETVFVNQETIANYDGRYFLGMIAASSCHDTHTQICKGTMEMLAWSHYNVCITMGQHCGSTADPKSSRQIFKLVFLTIGAAVAGTIWFSYNGRSASDTIVLQVPVRDSKSTRKFTVRRDTRNFAGLPSSSNGSLKHKSIKASLLSHLASDLEHELEKLSLPTSQGLSLHCGGRGWSKFDCPTCSSWEPVTTVVVISHALLRKWAGRPAATPGSLSHVVLCVGNPAHPWRCHWFGSTNCPGKRCSSALVAQTAGWTGTQLWWHGITGKKPTLGKL